MKKGENMTLIWGVVAAVIVGSLAFGYLVDRKSDRYKRMSDQKVKSGIEEIKDESQKGLPTNRDWNV